jgi:hypothetical protein
VPGSSRVPVAFIPRGINSTRLTVLAPEHPQKLPVHGRAIRYARSNAEAGSIRPDHGGLYIGAGRGDRYAYDRGWAAEATTSPGA